MKDNVINDNKKKNNVISFKKTNCFQCKKNINSIQWLKCQKCKGIICSCGACFCSWQNYRYWI